MTMSRPRAPTNDFQKKREDSTILLSVICQWTRCNNDTLQEETSSIRGTALPSLAREENTGLWTRSRDPDNLRLFTKNLFT